MVKAFENEEGTIFTSLGPLPRDPPKLPTNVLDFFSLKGKVAAISGASTGIGFTVAEAFAQAGGDVAMFYNSHSVEDKAAALSKKYGVKVQAYKVPVTDSDAVEEGIKKVVADFGKIDIFVANAGVPWTAGSLIDQPDHKEWNKVVDIDLNGAYYCTKFVGRQFKKQGFGSLIFTASMSGHIVNYPQMQACYNAIKASLIHLARSLAVEWSGFARVNSISPGYIATEISDFVPKETKAKWWATTPLGREGQPKELVGAYLYLASDASTYTTGTDIRVDGGYALP